MGIFKHKINNTAASPLPAPTPQTIYNHNHTTNWPGIIFAIVLSSIVTLPMLWWFLVYLFERLGSRQPEQQAALWVISIPLLLAGGWLIKWLVLAVLDSFFGYRLEMQKELTEQKRLELLARQSSVDSMRMNDEDRAFARLVIAIMSDAYEHGPKGARGEIRWSRRSAKAIAEQHNLGLSERKCGEVATWLLKYGVITDKDEISARYPDLGAVKVLINRVFNVPVVSGKDIGMTGHYLRGVDDESWN